MFAISTRHNNAVVLEEGDHQFILPPELARDLAQRILIAAQTIDNSPEYVLVLRERVGWSR